MATVRARVASMIKYFKLPGAYRHSLVDYLKNGRGLRECASLSYVIFDAKSISVPRWTAAASAPAITAECAG